MPVCSIVRLLPIGAMDDLMQYFTLPTALCNSASGGPPHRGVIVLTILQTGMKYLYIITHPSIYGVIVFFLLCHESLNYSTGQ